MKTSFRQAGSKTEAQLADAVRAWLNRGATDWDALVEEAALPDCDLWNAMPAIDSKTVARSSAIFDEHLGMPLDIKFIRPGGYASVDEAVNDILPKMIAKWKSGKAKRRRRRTTHE